MTIEVAQVHREPLDKLRETFSAGKVYGPYGPYQSNRQAYFMFMCYGEDAKTIVTQMLPYLFHKGEQVKEALAAYEEHKTSNT